MNNPPGCVMIVLLWHDSSPHIKISTFSYSTVYGLFYNSVLVVICHFGASIYWLRETVVCLSIIEMTWVYILSQNNDHKSIGNKAGWTAKKLWTFQIFILKCFLREYLLYRHVIIFLFQPIMLFQKVNCHINMNFKWHLIQWHFSTYYTNKSTKLARYWKMLVDAKSGQYININEPLQKRHDTNNNWTTSTTNGEGQRWMIRLFFALQIHATTQAVEK